MSQHDLGRCVINALEQYFRDLDGEKPAAIYDMVLKSVEKPMLEVVLAKAGILQERNACCFPGCESALVHGGATVTAYNVVTDGLITTSRGAGTAAAFGLELARLLVGDDKAREVGRTMLFA